MKNNESSPVKGKYKYFFEYLNYFLKPNMIFKLFDKNRNETIIKVKQDEEIILKNSKQEYDYKFTNFSEFELYLSNLSNLSKDFKRDNSVESQIYGANNPEEVQKLKEYYIVLENLINKTEEDKTLALNKAKAKLLKERDLLKKAKESSEQDKPIKDKKTQELELLKEMSKTNNAENREKYQKFNNEQIEELDEKIKGNNGKYTHKEIMSFVQERTNRKKDIKNIRTSQEFDDKIRPIQKQLDRLILLETLTLEKIEKTEKNITAIEKEIENIPKESAKKFDKEFGEYKSKKDAEAAREANHDMIATTEHSAPVLTNTDLEDLENYIKKAAEAARAKNVVNNENNNAEFDKELEEYKSTKAAEAAREANYDMIATTEHSAPVLTKGELRLEDLKKQAEEIKAELNEKTNNSQGQATKITISEPKKQSVPRKSG
ncbi:MAG: hypothetical protein K9G11_01860 [Rickettsiaceae bacterium]|nr:hypothetical protein [Rickettsiaceae bacterium]